MAYPTLNTNEIYAALFNQIISQRVFADNVESHFTTLIDENRVEGTLYGDTKTYFATDVLKSFEWGNDAEAANLLELYRAQDPETQTITLNKFRQIPLTTDNYLTKRAWQNEGSFAEFNSVMKTWVVETKKIHETTTFNSFVGTNETNVGLQTRTIALPASDTEEHRRMRASEIADFLADLFIEIEDYNRDYNDYGNLRAIGRDKLMVVWNSKVLNSIQKLDMPTIFHSDAILDGITKYQLPSRYFGTVLADGGTATASNKTIRSLVERDYNEVKMDDESYDEKLHVFPGDLIPNNKPYNANEAYTEDGSILFKIITKRSIPFMTSMSVATDFFNPKSLTETMYLTFGYNTLQHLKNYPMITVRATGKK